MENLQCGQIIKSKAGRDQNKYFIVIDIKEEYAYLTDGDLRKFENPKKKKRKHIQPTNNFASAIKEKIEKEERITNADIRNELIAYQNDPDNRKEV